MLHPIHSGCGAFLRISETEAQVVERIVEGLTPSQRARLVFQGPPTNFKHLEQLIIVDRNITFADQTRQPVVSTSRAETRQLTSDVITSRFF
jgi:hypothetical protein